jgi:hypothetical protein
LKSLQQEQGHTFHHLEHQKQQGADARSQNADNREEPKQQERLYSDILNG